MKYICESKIYMAYVHDIFSKLNIDFKKVKRIGEGENGIAFLHDDRIYKITADPKEVELANILINEKSRRYVQIFDIYCLDTKVGEDNMLIEHSNKPRYYWVIICEHLNTKSKVSYYYYDALLYFRKYIEDNKDFDYSKELFDRMLLDYQADMEFDFNEIGYEDNDTYHYLKLLRELFLELQKYGISDVVDLKSCHVGMKNGEHKFYDLRLSKGITKDIRNIKQLT
jgi:hypothetical protein